MHEPLNNGAKANNKEANPLKPQATSDNAPLRKTSTGLILRPVRLECGSEVWLTSKQECMMRGYTKQQAIYELSKPRNAFDKAKNFGNRSRRDLMLRLGMQVLGVHVCHACHRPLPPSAH